MGVFCISYGFHLLGDLKPGKEGKVLGYLIFKRKGDKMSRKATDAYLALNGLFCVIASVIALLLANIYK
ncbi:MAG: hypothetical protein BV459_01980 [Thermoplasmata archaeon M11B2D]|nr:MAG: hypothetical protein BV459_01980 [Thermoplasmata archaeon M11B2D]